MFKEIFVFILFTGVALCSSAAVLNSFIVLTNGYAPLGYFNYLCQVALQIVVEIVIYPIQFMYELYVTIYAMYYATLWALTDIALENNYISG